MRSLVIVLALLSACDRGTGKPPLGESEATALFFDKGYTFCDAELLRAEWGQQMSYGAKIRAGRFLDLPRGQNRVGAFAADVRKQAAAQGHVCTIWDLGMNDSDVELLSTLWGTDRTQTKAKISREYLASRGRGLFDELPDRVNMGGYGGKYGYNSKGYIGYAGDHLASMRDFTALDATVFTHCDAERLARVWRISTDQAVEALQRKAVSWTPSDKLASMQAVRAVTPDHICDFHPDFSYDDVRALSRIWGTDIMDTKFRLGEKLDNGWAAWTLQSLNHRGSLPALDAEVAVGLNRAFEDPDAAAFTASGHTMCDATLLGHLWSETPQQAKVSIATRFLNESQRTELPALRADAGRLASVDGVACSFDDDYSIDDAQTMATYWHVSVAEAQEMAVAKLTTGVSQPYLREALGQSQ